MAASVSVAYSAQATATETLGTGVPDANDPSIVHALYNTTVVLNSTSTPPVSKMASFSQALAAGVATVDLTALVGTNGAAVTFNGLRLSVIRLLNPSTNANSITIVPGASNGHTALGAAFKIVLLPGEEFLWKGYNTGTAVDGTHKNWDLSGTGAQSLSMELVAG